MKFGGIQKLSLIDFPNLSACILFTVGCNFRCGYCHNSELVLAGAKYDALDEDEIFKFLNERLGLLDGVSITGGEPTLHSDLPRFIEKLKSMGFKVKLDTNGTNPKMLGSLLKDGLLDYVAMDVKASLANYENVVACDINIELLKRSRDLIMGSGIDYEFRTTVLPALHDEEEFIEILKFIEGAGRFFIQNFSKQKGCLNSTFDRFISFSKADLQRMKLIAEGFVEFVGVRE